MEFDYVIVGAGSSGAVLASRLSEDGTKTVCLIEAGKPDRSVFITVPMGLFWTMQRKTFNWAFETAPQDALGGRSIPVPRGKTLGGSSAINGMIYIRGHRTDYDGWAASGCTGWGWDEVLPYFKKSEANVRLGGDPLHGADGPLWVSDNRDPHPLSRRFIEAGEALQIRAKDDFNGAEQDGLGMFQTTTRDGKRWSTADAFIRPALNRANLQVLTGRQVRRLILEGRRAVGVETDQGAIRARAEVILSAGAIGSPQILQLSGIGDPARLKPLGIDAVLDAPEVGGNFHDHPHVSTARRMKAGASYGISHIGIPQAILGGIRYLYTHRGMFASTIIEAGGFVRTEAGLEAPDIQFHFNPAHRSREPGRVLAWGHGCSLSVCVLRPESRGRVDIASADPGQAPKIDPGLMAAAKDQATMLRGLKLARRIMDDGAFGGLKSREVSPGPDVQSDDALMDYIRGRTVTVYHPVGSCRMGADAGAVCAPDLRVNGVERLRVVDCSVMPKIVSGNTNAPAIMIAEKAADMIRAAALG